MDHALALREHLKESFRARLKKETPSPSGATDHDTNLRTPYRGHFFGPSETVVSDRVLALLRNEKPTKPRVLTLLPNKKSTNPDAKLSFGFGFESTKVEPKSDMTEKEKKLKFTREARDYSFLLAGTGTGEIPGPQDKARNIYRPGNKARNISRPEDPEKKKPLEASKGKAMVRKALVSKQSQSQPSTEKSKRKQEGRDNKEEINAIGMIRQMFRYDPTKYGDDRDDGDLRMEAGFRDIEKEERRSAKIARKEDDEELRKLSVQTPRIRREILT